MSQNREPTAHGHLIPSDRPAATPPWPRILLLSLASIFVVELGVMWLLDRLGIPQGVRAALVDGVALTFLVLPLLYFTAMRPVIRLAAAAVAGAAAHARFRLVVDETADAIVVGDRAGRIVYANPSTLDLLGYAAGELDGADIAVIVPEDLRPRHTEGMRRYRETGETRVIGHGVLEAEALAKDGRRIPVGLVITAAHDEGLLIAIMRDTRQMARLRLYEAVLPTCSMYGLVRDDTGVEQGRGRWGRLEEYVRARSSTRFSHGLCPDCLTEYRGIHGLPPA